MISVDKIREIAEVKIKEGENYIVEIKVKPGNKITIALDNDKAISIADCVEMSRYVESHLDREKEDFELSVMSAGMSEPFKITRQYIKNIGRQVDVVTKEGEKYSGKLTAANEEEITLETKVKEKKGKQVVISNINLKYNQIKETKRVISF